MKVPYKKEEIAMHSILGTGLAGAHWHSHRHTTTTIQPHADDPLSVEE